MKRPEFYYAALDFKKHFNMLTDLEVSKIELNLDYEYYTRYGIYRGNNYQIVFTRLDKIVTVIFVYTNFKRPHCDFTISYSFLYSDVLKNFVDFKDFSISMSTMLNSFFYNKQFKTDCHFLR